MRHSRWTLRDGSITFDNAMAAITHVRNQHAVLTPESGDVGERLAALAADLFSADAATRAVERAFLDRLLRILALTPHEVHDLAVAGRLTGMLPPDTPGAAEPIRFADLAGWRDPK
jgi:hypothetical protein